MIDLSNFSSSKIVTSLEITRILESEKQSSILVKGAYDVIHSGHILSFINAKNLADILIVCIASDASIKKNKGNDRPYNNLLHRLIVLSNIELIDYIVIFDNVSIFETIKEIRPTYFGASHFAFLNDNEKIEISNFTRLINIPKTGENSTSKIMKVMENEIILQKERKLNLHLKLDVNISTLVKEINIDINKEDQPIIDFSSNEKIMIPHITVIMGYLDEYKYSVKELIEKIVPLIRSFPALPFSLSQPYIENQKHNYVFSDVTFGDEFKQLQNLLFEHLEPNVLNVQTDFNKQSHLTLGYVTSNHARVSQMLASKYNNFVIEGKSTTIELSDVGPKGTCINSLWSYDLQ